MKKSFARLSIKLAILVFGLLGFAAGKVHAQVSFTANATLTGNWDAFPATVTVLSGSSATTLTVNAGTIVVTVANTDTFTLSTTSNIAFTNDFQVIQNCGNPTQLIITGRTGTITITPTNVPCTVEGVTGPSRQTTPTTGGGGPQCLAPKAAVITRGTGGKNPDGMYSAVLEWDNPTGVDSTKREYEVFRGAEGAASFDEMAKLEAIPGTSRRYTDSTNTLRPVTYSYGLRVWETPSGCAKQSKDSTVLNVRISPGVPVSVTPVPETPTATEPEKPAEKVEIPVVEKKEEPSLREKVKERKLKRTAPPEANPHDVLNRSEFLKIVAEASSQNAIIKKYSKGKNTGPTVSRAEALKILFDAFDVEVPRRVTKISFRDVKANTWYAPYVETAKDMDLLESRTFRSRFSPSLDMKRGILDEMLKGLQGGEGEGEGEEDMEE